MQVLFTSSVNGMRMSIKTSLGPKMVFLYPVKKFSSSFTFLVCPFVEKKENKKKVNVNRRGSRGGEMGEF